MKKWIILSMVLMSIVSSQSMLSMKRALEGEQDASATKKQRSDNSIVFNNEYFDQLATQAHLNKSMKSDTHILKAHLEFLKRGYDADKNSIAPILVESFEQEVSRMSTQLDTRMAQALNNEDVDTVKDLLDKGANPDIYFEVSETPGAKEHALVYAIKEGNLELVEALISGGAQLNIKSYNLDGSYNTPLWYAIAEDDVEIAAKIIAADANLNSAVDSHTGANALIVAVQKDLADIAKVLIFYGANLNFKDKNGKSLYDYIDKQQTPEVASLFEDIILLEKNFGLQKPLELSRYNQESIRILIFNKFFQGLYKELISFVCHNYEELVTLQFPVPEQTTLFINTINQWGKIPLPDQCKHCILDTLWAKVSQERYQELMQIVQGSYTELKQIELPKSSTLLIEFMKQWSQFPFDCQLSKPILCNEKENYNGTMLGSLYKQAKKRDIKPLIRLMRSWASNTYELSKVKSKDGNVLPSAVASLVASF